MANDLINLIPQDAEEVAAFIEAARTIAGASKFAQSAVLKYFGPALERNWRQITDKAKQLRDKVSPERHTPQTPSLLIPLVDAACQEDRQELQDLWAALLANSMVDEGKKVRREFIEAFARFEPSDALTLQIIAEIPSPRNWRDATAMNANSLYLENKKQEFNLENDIWEVACNALQRLDCISSAFGVAGAPANQHPSLTPFGRRLLAALTVV